MIKQKPKVDSFIDAAKADLAVVPEPTVKAHEKAPGNEKNDTQTAGAKKTKMTFYMTPEMYIAWKNYELQLITSGNKTSFQKVVENYMLSILDMG